MLVPPESQFHVASFNFHSEVYEWLVMAGAKAQYKERTARTEFSDAVWGGERG